MAQRKDQSAQKESIGQVATDPMLLVGISLIANIPVVTVGPPGGAKTSMHTELCDRLGWYFEPAILSTWDPADVGGVMMPDQSRQRSVRLLPDFFVALMEEGQKRNCLLYLDEISHATRASSAAALRLVNERSIGKAKMPDTVRIAASMNSVEDGGQFLLSKPMANRMVHVPWKLQLDRWLQHMRGLDSLKNSLDLLDGERAKNWEVCLPHAQGLIAMFMQAKPNALWPDRTLTDEEAGGPWPSPRSWKNAARLCAVAEKLGLDGTAVQTDLLRCTVGDGGAMEFMSWVKSAELEDPEEILLDPQKAELPKRDDVAFALLGAISAAVACNLTSKRWDMAWAYFDRVAKARGVDIVAPAARELCVLYRSNLNNGKKGKGKLQLELPETLELFLPMFKMLGYLK